MLLAGTAIRADDATDLEKLIAKLNTDAQKSGGEKEVLDKISESTHVPVTVLAAQKKRTNLSYGEIYAINSIARGAGRSFDNIAGLKAEGKTWRQIVRDSRVSMVRGSGKAAQSDKTPKEGEKSKGKGD